MSGPLKIYRVVTQDGGSARCYQWYAARSDAIVAAKVYASQYRGYGPPRVMVELVKIEPTVAGIAAALQACSTDSDHHGWSARVVVSTQAKTRRLNAKHSKPKALAKIGGVRSSPAGGKRADRREPAHRRPAHRALKLRFFGGLIAAYDGSILELKA